MGIERRQFKRVPASLEVRFKIDGIEYLGMISDISIGGCYIQSPAVVKLRTPIVVGIHLTAQRWFDLHGLIMHHYPNQGFGIRFEFSSEAEEDLIARLVEHLDNKDG
jgi:hypothetical protein